MALRFVSPAAEWFTEPEWGERLHSYAYRNYLRPGIAPWIRRRRFIRALHLARESFGGRAVDFGCADGVFLPTLARHFTEVVGVDVHRQHTEVAQHVAARAGATNVRVVCNHGLNAEQIRDLLGPEGYDVVFALETLEHVGERGTMYEDKVELLGWMRSWVRPGGRIILSVPRMVGPLFGLRHVALTALRQAHEPMSWGEVYRAAVWSDTRALEPRWDRGHVGFSDRTLERLLRADGWSIERHGGAATVFYVLRV